MKRVLLTGATGFVGRQCVAPLQAAGYEVHAVSTTAVDQIADRLVWHQANLLDPDSASALMYRVRPEALLHLAWYAIPGSYPTSIENFRWVQATLGLLQSFADVGGERIVCAGSCAEYEPTDEACSELTTPTRGTTPYAACKSALQSMLSAFAAKTDISSAWGRIFYAYGPFEYPQRLVASVALSLIKGEPALCSHGGQIRDFLHVADVGSAFAALLATDVRGAVNIASGEAVSIREVVNTIAVITARPDLIRLGAISASPNEPERLVADVRRLREEVGWAPRYTLTTGLTDAVEWWQANAAGPGLKENIAISATAR